MKQLFIVIALLTFSAPLFAQRYYNCQVGMIDQYNRIIMRFFAQRDYRNGMCREGLRQCHFEIRRRNLWGVRCVQLNK